jgi:hypothetical protein
MGTVSTRIAQWTDGFDERKKLYDDLPLITKTLVDTEKFNGDTNTASYLLFNLEIVPNGHIKAIETDTPPRMFVKEVVSGKSGVVGTLVLPYYVASEFVDTFPDFITCLISQVRYIKYGGDGTDRKTFVKGQINNKITDLDIFETYIQALHGTLDKYYREPTIEDEKNIWRLMHTLKIIVTGMKKRVNIKKIPMETMVQYDKVLHAVRNRDSSFTDASSYKRTITGISPFIYYSIMYNAMITDYDVVHVSNFVQSDMLLGGLFLMNELDDGARIEGIEDMYLRMLYEKAIRCFTKENFKGFLEVGKIINHLHQESGKRFHSYLKYNTFILEVYRYIFLGDELTMSQTGKMLREIKTHIKDLSGINVFSHRLAPSCEKYLTDEKIAEFIINACNTTGSNKKFSKLETNMFSTYNETLSVIHKTVKANISDVEKAQKEIESIEKKMSEMLVEKPVDSTLSSAEVPSFLDEFSKTITPHKHSPAVSMRFKVELATLITVDNHLVIDMLKKLLTEIAFDISPLLGTRRIYAMICRECIPGGIVEEWLISIGKRKIEGSTFKKNSAYGNAKKYTKSEVTMFRTFVEEDEKNDIESDAFEFVKFESALENNVKKVTQYFKDLCAIRDECPICVTVKMLIPLHGDVRHRICKVCRDSTVGDKCPICRADL